MVSVPVIAGKPFDPAITEVLSTAVMLYAPAARLITLGTPFPLAVVIAAISPAVSPAATLNTAAAAGPIVVRHSRYTAAIVADAFAARRSRTGINNVIIAP